MVLLDDKVAAAGRSCGEWPATLLVGEFGLDQFEAVTAGMSLETLFLI